MLQENYEVSSGLSGSFKSPTKKRRLSDEILLNDNRNLEETSDSTRMEKSCRRRKSENIVVNSSYQTCERERHRKISAFEMGNVIRGSVLGDDLANFAHNAAFQAENAVRKIIEVGWSAKPFHHLPKWMQDNEHLLFGHRPPLPSFDACFKSIFRLHTETGNIWTHLLGCLTFICLATYFHLWPHIEVQSQEKVIFGVYFVGAIICLLFSTLFHTVNCHSEPIGSLFLKLDYCGITLLIVGSYIPWLYFVFYCNPTAMVVYLTMMCSLGFASIVISLWDKFSQRSWRVYRASIFMAFALSGLIPSIHFGQMEGWFDALVQKALLWLFFSGMLYIIGTVLYALRIPESLFPGKFDIWLHSHQIFHTFVFCGALVHYFGISKLATHRLGPGQCVF